MADETINPAPAEEGLPTPLTGEEAIEAVNEAMAILPKQRLGCLRRVAKYFAVLAVLLGAFVYWNFLRTPRLRISKETTYVTEPLTSDGTRVDYFRAFEQELYPPEMKTDDNGYRLIVCALGDVADHEPHDSQGNKIEYDAQAATAQVYEKLGLGPSIRPTMQHREPILALLDYVKREGRTDRSPDELARRLHQPWTLDDLPIMKSWLDENGPILDLLGKAVRKPTFFMPLIRKDPDATLFESLVQGQIHRVRSFTRSLEARANYRLGTGDIDGALDDVITQKRLGRHLQRHTTIVELLVGIAVEGIADSIGVAAVRERQPTAAQLRRFLAELDASPRPLDLDRLGLGERLGTLDLLQAMAHGKRRLADLFADSDERFSPGIAQSLTLDWNVLMRRVNAYYDDWGQPGPILPLPPHRPTLGNLLIGARSHHVADCMAFYCRAPYRAMEEARRRTNCSNNLRRIALAMLLYEHEHGTLPPAYTVDATGKPLQSWRVLLLPYLGEERLFAQIRLDEPWNSGHNRQFHDAAVVVYQCPSAALQRGQTAYSVVVGKQTAFRPAEGRSLDDVGMNLVLVVERWKPVCWMDPASELTETVALNGVKRRSEGIDGMGCEHPGLVLAAMRDGSTRFLSCTLESSALQRLLDGTAKEPPQ